MLWVEEAGSGPPVVLIHNGVMDARTWDPQFQAFSERFRVVRYDCPGFGRSAPIDEPYRETDLLLGLLDELGIAEAALVGGSRGGALELDFALAHPERVTALVLVCTGLSGFRLAAYSEEQGAREEAALNAGDWHAVADVTLDVWGARGPGDGVRDLVLANAQADLLTEQALPPERPAIDRLEEIRVPALVITGDHDQPGMDEIAELLEARIAGAERIRFAASDHFPNMREPERFNAVVLDFLSRA